MSKIIDETINELNKPTQNNVFSIEDNPVTVLEKINQVERYLKQIDTRVDTSINTANEALEKASNAFEANGTLVKINGENQLTWSADFAESERQKSETDGAIVHEKGLIEKSMTLIDKIYVPDESYSQLRFDNLPGNYNYKLIVIGSATTAFDGSIKINDTDLKSITLSTNSDDTNVVNTFGDTALIRVDNGFRIDAEISVADTYVGTPIAMEINNISSSSNTKFYGRKTSSLIRDGRSITSITIDIGTSKFYRGTQAFLYKLGDTKWKRF